MSWKKYFTPVDTDGRNSPLASRSTNKAGPAKTNYSSYLPDVYSGSPNRIERYQQLEQMDADSEIAAALDILAEFCTQKLKDSKVPFSVQWRSKATNSEVRILSEYLQQWCKLQQFDTRIFRIVRNVFKYGDAFFIRDPETQQWCWIDPSKVVKVIVNESDGKKPEQYVIKDLAPNFVNLVATQITPNINPRQNAGGVTSGAGFTGAQTSQRGTSGPFPSSSTGSRFGLAETEHAIAAEHVVHLSLSEGLDNNFPFGNSLLENVFKVFKQKELLEDAILIYRIQRAPERRVFHIDVGSMPTHLAMAFVERVKNEIHQRRIPSQTGGGCFAMDTRVPLLDGRTLSIAELATEYQEGKENWAYSCDPKSGSMVPGLITWAGVTQKSAKVIKLTLDNGQEIICTPEHKFPVVGKGKTEAKDIIVGEDSLFSFNTRYEKLDRVSNTYHKVVKIEYIDELIEVGTLTIDGNEIYHDYHTFAIEQGVYTFNSNVIDSAYSPIGINEDFFFPQGSDGRGSKVEVLPGGQNIGEITDLRYFTNKLFRGLRIPSSYLPTGADDSQASFNDGRVGTAYIQELRFNKYCERLQSLITEVFDREFKLYMNSRGLNIDSNLFEIQFNPPMNFASSRQSAVDAERINTFNTIQGVAYMSKRFAMKRFLGLTAEEIAENERLWAEEHHSGEPTATDAAGELRSAGLSAAGIEGDLGMAGNTEAPDEMASDLEGMPGAEPLAGAEPTGPAAS